MKVPLNLSQWLLVLAALALCTQAKLVDIFKKPAPSVAPPVDGAVVISALGSSQCTALKELLGLNFEQVDGFREPNFNELTLNFRSQALQMTFNLTTAAHLMSEVKAFEPSNKLVIYIHGFIDNPNSNNFGAISDAFLKTGEYNIMGVDGSSLIGWMYLRSSTYVHFIGERLAEALNAMVQRGLDPKSIHVVGHSLGAHIAGFTGKHFKSLTGSKIGRITGLDPAGPCFTDDNLESRLNSNDAEFVDVIHTDGGVYGLTNPIGHVDFYPNSGSMQPKCLLHVCSHNRVNELFAESVLNPQAFQAKACRDWDAFQRGLCTDEVSVMGYGCQPTTRGQFYLRTREDAPYGMGAKGLKWAKTGILGRILNDIPNRPKLGI